MHNSFEVNKMSILKLMTIDQKEKTDEHIYYYYSINVLYNDSNLSGILSLSLELFEKLPTEIKDYTLFAMELFINKKIEFVRPTQQPLELPDCPDLHGIIAAAHIIRRYKETNTIPKFVGTVSKELIDALLQYDEFAQFFIDNAIMSKEDIKEYRKENKIVVKELSKNS